MKGKCYELCLTYTDFLNEVEKFKKKNHLVQELQQK